MVTEPAKTFTKKLWGYEPASVDSHVETLTTKQQLLRDDVESLRVRLRESGDELAALRTEIAMLVETSSSPHAVQQRMAKMLRSAVDEISQMQAEAQAEADAVIAEAAAEAEAERRKHEERVAEMVAREQAVDAEYEETKRKLNAEYEETKRKLNAEYDDAWQAACEEREQLLADAKLQADHEREQARRAVNDAREQRIRILENLMDVYRGLGFVPATLDAAYQDRTTPAEAVTADSVDEKVSTG